MKKTITRRSLLKTGAKAGLILPVLGFGLWSCSSNTAEKASEKETDNKKLSILILGGTSFLGPHQIAYAISRGHSVSTFTRGKTKPTIHTDIFEQVEQLIGDRENDLSALENREWDVVIDNSGRKEDWTKKSAELLKDKVGLYLYTSSTGVYFPYLRGNVTEQKEVLLEVPEGIEDEYLKMEYDYGVMKAKSELAAIHAFGEDRAIIVRPTYMIGPGDKTDRFIHWPIRLSRGGEALVPGRADDPVQYVDVRDVAEWMIRLAEEKTIGIYNAVGPAGAQNVIQFIVEAQKAFDVETAVVLVDDYAFLRENNIHYIIPWILEEENSFGSARINNEKAIKAGLTFRELKTSVKDTYDWWYSDALTEERRRKYEQNPESILQREEAILKAWKELAS